MIDDGNNIESTRIGLSNSGPLANAVLYNNGKAVWDALVSAGIVIFPVGMLSPFAGSSPPSGWLLCYGQTLNATTSPEYGNLFSVIGTNYGGTGASNFQLPDLRGRVVAGKDDMGGSAANRLTSAGSGVAGATLGASGGDELSQSHTHSNTLSNSTVASSSHRHQYAARILEYYSMAQVAGSGTPGIGLYNYNNGTWATWVHPVTTVGANVQVNNGIVYSSGTWISQAGSANSGTPSATTTVGISNANSGFGNSENVQPTTVANYIIKF